MGRIVLFAGHHAGSQGASNTQFNLTEYAVGSKIVLLCEEMLTQAGHSVYVGAGTLREKIQQVNENHDRARVDLAIDLHFNADADHIDPNDWDDSRGDGCMTMVVPRSDRRMEQGILFNSIMAGQLGEPDKRAREGWYWGGDAPGTKPDAFLVQTKCPAIIPEPGYIDNNGFCERHLLGERWEGVAGALSAAIMGYLEKY
jgi:hypothetical protein